MEVYNTPGTYTITYTAEDDCGNETVVTRNCIVSDATYRTVLYPDGTLIINESSVDQAANEQAHGGTATNVYDPLDAQHTYVMSSNADQPWASERTSIEAVEFGSAVAPTELAHWFNGCTNLADIDFTNCDASAVTTIRGIVASTALTSITLPSMPNLTSIRYAFAKSESLTSVDFSNVGADGITETTDAFQGCYGITTIDLTGLGGTVSNSERMFANANGDGKGDMNITTIISCGGLDFSQASASANMFRTCTSLVGGDGTTFDSTKVDKTRAKIDGGQSDPGYFTRCSDPCLVLLGGSESVSVTNANVQLTNPQIIQSYSGAGVATFVNLVHNNVSYGDFDVAISSNVLRADVNANTFMFSLSETVTPGDYNNTIAINGSDDAGTWIREIIDGESSVPFTASWDALEIRKQNC